jgi:phosphatidylglycerophosphate synthase
MRGGSPNLESICSAGGILDSYIDPLLDVLIYTVISTATSTVWLSETTSW